MTAPSWKVGKNALGLGMIGDAPTRCKKTGEFEFGDAPDFRPNMSPAEVLKAGSFGGGYYRDISSTVTGESYKDAWKELPPAWLEGVDVKKYVSSKTYRPEVNTYGVNCGVKVDKSDSFGLKAWENSGWMDAQDPYGWFQWYCRFFQGRRSDDDERQLSRWHKCCGARGRWKSNLIAKVLRADKSFDDASVSPVVRQTLQHWGFRLTKAHFEAGAKRVKTHGAAYVPRESLAGVMTKKPAAKKPRDESDDEAPAPKPSAAAQSEDRAARAKKRAKKPAAKKPRGDAESDDVAVHGAGAGALLRDLLGDAPKPKRAKK